MVVQQNPPLLIQVQVLCALTFQPLALSLIMLFVNILLSCIFLFLNINCQSILHLPLDERFATRVTFLNLARMTPFEINTQPQDLLPSLKQSPDPQKIQDWFSIKASSSNGAIVSMEMLLHGGLIGSRTSNYSLDSLLQKLDQLQAVKTVNPKLKIYASAVVMRIPSYNSNFEEPEYWDTQGRSIFEYSYYCHKYTVTHDPKDKQESDRYKQMIPDDVLFDFTWRRARNHAVLHRLLEMLSQSKKRGSRLFEQLYITLDDNAEYGFNIEKANQLKALVNELKLTDDVLIYPGADQVPLALLSKYIVDYKKLSGVELSVKYRNESTSSLIPNYQGDPLNQTIDRQIRAAGGLHKSNSKVMLLVNNFDGPGQKQANEQFSDIKVNYSFIDPYLNTNYYFTGFVDSRYSNGADISFIDYFLTKSEAQGTNMTRFAYAGWNTNGNTLGTVISNIILLYLSHTQSNPIDYQLTFYKVFASLCPVCSPCAQGDYICGNAYFNLLRILEDRDWQAVLRQKMLSYLAEVPTDNFNHLDSDQSFYQKFSLKSMQAKSKRLAEVLKLPVTIDRVYYPWNRTFEIGIVGSLRSSNYQGPTIY